MVDVPADLVAARLDDTPLGDRIRASGVKTLPVSRMGDRSLVTLAGVAADDLCAAPTVPGMVPVVVVSPPIA